MGISKSRMESAGEDPCAIFLGGSRRFLIFDTNCIWMLGSMGVH
jgi:hypothetical protein